MIDQVLFIGGKDLELAKLAVTILGREFYAEAINFFNTNVYLKRTLKRFPRIFILHKSQEEEFKERFSEIYEGKNIVCFNIPEDIEIEQMKKELTKSMMPYLKEILDEML